MIFPHFMDPVYEPDDDTFLLWEVIEKELDQYAASRPLASCSLLDMGSGSGYLGIQANNAGVKVTFADINPAACERIKQTKKDANIIQTDLFENINDKFDIIVFNTPYLPNEEDEEVHDPSLHGGPVGNEVSLRFLKEVKNYLNDGGVVLLLTSSHANPKELEKLADELDFSWKIVAMKSIFFEVLYVYRFTR